MPTTSKFTAARRAAILELLSAGASRRTAAAVAGVDHATLGRWIRRGETAREGSRFAEFAAAVRQAEAAPRMRALQIVNEAMDERPDLAWKFIERREHGFAPKRFVPDPPQPTAGVIRLRFRGQKDDQP